MAHWEIQDKGGILHHIEADYPKVETNGSLILCKTTYHSNGSDPIKAIFASWIYIKQYNPDEEF